MVAANRSYILHIRMFGGSLIGRFGFAALCSLLMMATALDSQTASNHGQSGQRHITDWHAMGTAPCAWSVPFEKQDHSLDVDRTIKLLQQGGFTCEITVIEDRSPRTWDEFVKLAAAANSANIDLWPVILPPSEGSSQPYGHDYVSWIEAFAKLSLQYSHVRGANIDDLDQGVSPKTFTRDYVCQIYSAKQKINPKLLFVPTIYDLDRKVADRLAGCVDGVWLWWVNLEKATGLPSFLENSKLAASGRFPVYGGIYAHSTTWHTEGNPLPPVFTETLEDSCEHADGTMIWNLSLEPQDPLLKITKTFMPGGSSPLAGKCAQSGAKLADQR